MRCCVDRQTSILDHFMLWYCGSLFPRMIIMTKTSVELPALMRE
jgi:hypothetical protein